VTGPTRPARPGRPGRLIVVTGTGTEVGKTWVGAALARHLIAAGIAVAARKPAQSFATGDGPTDAEVLGAATGEAPTTVCPERRWYGTPMAPPMAADALGRPPFTIADLTSEIVWPDGDGDAVGLVEGAGGPRSPLASDGDTVDLAAALGPDLVVVVADAGLGTINAVRLAVTPFDGLAPVCVVLNRYDDTDELQRRNHAWLASHTELDVILDVPTLAARVEELG
jgi:dethiobiotin synthetase